VLQDPRNGAAGKGLPTGRILFALALLQAGYQASLAFRGLPYILTRIIIDDGYYYLEVAWNVSRLGFVTFDGIHRTNGLQFLWLWILSGLAALAQTKNGLQQASLALSIFLNALCYYPIQRVGRVFGRDLFVLVVAGAWFHLNLVWACSQISGMENPLQAWVSWSLVACVVELASSPGEIGGSSLALLASLLTLNVWCRVDAALVSALVSLFFIAEQGRRITPRSYGAAGAIACFGALVMFGGYFAMGGSFLPVSALIKSQAHQWSFALFPELAARGVRFLTPLSFLVPRRWGLDWKIIWAPLAAAVGVLAGALRILPRTGSPWAPLRPIWWGFGLASLVQTLYLSGLGEYALYGVWYQVPYFVFTALTLGMVTQEWVDWLRHRGWLGKAAGRRWGVGLALLYVMFAAAWIRDFTRQGISPEDFGYVRYRMATWLREHTQPGDVIAAYNAGEIGYFSERAVIDLDGLVNDYAYYEEFVRGHGDLSTYLSGKGVRYVGDYKIPVHLPESSRVVWTKRDSEGNVFRIVQLPEEAGEH
jgi:hypothetical protein